MFNNSGCKSDTPIIPDSLIVGDGAIQCKVDGTFKKSTIVGANQYTLTGGEKVLQVNGLFDPKVDGISLFINEPAVGTIAFSDTVAGLYIADVNDPDAQYAAVDGSVTITVLTTKIVKGTFKFKGQTVTGDKTKEITEGKFECKVVSLLEPPTTVRNKKPIIY